jgi:hypothetical protein
VPALLLWKKALPNPAIRYHGVTNGTSEPVRFWAGVPLWAWQLARASGALHAVVRDGRRERRAHPLGIHRDLDAGAFLLKQVARMSAAKSGMLDALSLRV